MELRHSPVENGWMDGSAETETHKETNQACAFQINVFVKQVLTLSSVGSGTARFS